MAIERSRANRHLRSAREARALLLVCLSAETLFLFDFAQVRTESRPALSFEVPAAIKKGGPQALP
ncbi:hypothetical protein CHELA40_11014 [Chelatococcus asaccharovorans]|nr:hypothetical protein CHELA40_11014 [Chelatococcus asaccharovorans]CAH1685591.1 hypothetical protein CHELA17_64583 [Chelatococcus asaccharovorans]